MSDEPVIPEARAYTMYDPETSGVVSFSLELSPDRKIMVMQSWPTVNGKVIPLMVSDAAFNALPKHWQESEAIQRYPMAWKTHAPLAAGACPKCEQPLTYSRVATEGRYKIRATCYHISHGSLPLTGPERLTKGVAALAFQEKHDG